MLWRVRSFDTFSVTSSIAADLGGDPTNLIKELGWLALAMYLIACALLAVFTVWGNAAAKRHLASQRLQVRNVERV